MLSFFLLHVLLFLLPVEYRFSRMYCITSSARLVLSPVYGQICVTAGPVKSSARINACNLDKCYHAYWYWWENKADWTEKQTNAICKYLWLVITDSWWQWILTLEIRTGDQLLICDKEAWSWISIEYFIWFFFCQLRAPLYMQTT